MFVLIQWCCQPGGQRLKQYRHKKLRSLTQVSNFHDTLVLYLLMYENSRSLSTYFQLISLERKFDFAISYFSGLMGQGHTYERVLKQGEGGLRCKMQFLYIGAQGPSCTSWMAQLWQDKNKVSSFNMCLTGRFLSRTSSVKTYVH